MLIDAFRRGEAGRCVHLGHFEAEETGFPSWSTFTRAQDRLTQILLGMARLSDGQTVLDVGCGLGAAGEMINRDWREMTLIGLNVDARQIDVCRSIRSERSNLHLWIKGDGCRLPIRSRSVDRLLCIEALFHFRSRQAFFQESARVLRPGGLLVLSDFTIAPMLRDPAIPGFALEALLRDGYGPWPAFWTSISDLDDLAGKAGLKCVERFDATQATRPSYRYTVPPGPSVPQDPGQPTLRASLALKWLHENRFFEYHYLRYQSSV